MAVLKQELNSIRFGASDTVIVKLGELDVVNKESLDFASLMMNRLLGFMLAGDSDSIKRDSAMLTEIAVRVNQAVEDLRSAMRKDLSEI
ncbi:MAG TPA: hypothetical protein VEW65_02615 [Chryseolinea sp.]|nr:hypothetical protein [Chryseolinea sp.]